MDKIDIDLLILDDRLQPRRIVQQGLVNEYREAIEEAGHWPFPPLQVFRHDDEFGERMYVVDGWHRCLAARAAGMEEALCEVRDGTFDMAFAASLSANARHGARRTIEDKHMSVLRALKHPSMANKSDREIAGACAVSHTYVAQIRRSLASKDAQEDPAVQRAESISERIHNPGSGQPAVQPDELPKTAAKASAIASSKPALAAIKGHWSVLGHEMESMQVTEKMVVELAKAKWASKITASRMRTTLLDAHAAIKEARDSLDQLSSMIQMSAPYARCSKCMGSGCDHCSGHGWITEAQYRGRQ